MSGHGCHRQKNMSPRFSISWVLVFVLAALSARGSTCPDVCACDEQSSMVDCSGRGLESLPDRLPPPTVWLNLDNNYFTSIPPELQYLRNLTKLDLSHNRITIIKYNDLMYKLDRLKYLDLSFNLFRDSIDIKFDAFSDLPALEELDMSNNFIRKMYPFHSSSLRRLLLHNCSLRAIDMTQLLKNAPNLRELNASYNHLLSIPASSSNSLEKLDLSNCHIEVLKMQDFSGLVALKYLYMTNNRNLRSFHCNCTKLVELHLSDSTLENIPGGYLRNVQTANLRGNNIRYIEQRSLNAFHSLKYLDLSYNAIKVIKKGAFNGLKDVVKIDLSFNTLTFLEFDLFKNCRALKILLLSHNYISRVELASDSLAFLDVSSCEIGAMNHQSLQEMPGIESLNLSSNFLAELPDHLFAANLYNLDASLCRIASINNKTFDRMPSLKMLKLSGNRLTTLDPSYFRQVLYLEIDDNPWRCDCGSSLRHTYEWATGTGMPTDRLLCQSPENVQGQTWAEACVGVWYPKSGGAGRPDTIWYYSVALIVAMAVAATGVAVTRHFYRVKERRLREAETIRRQEEREALRRMRRAEIEVVVSEPGDSRGEVIGLGNAPDPREYQRPPSYHEALLMPKLDPGSVSGSLHSLASLTAPSSRHGSQTSLHQQARKAKLRRKRRKRHESGGTDSQRTSRTARTSGSSSNDECPPPPPQPPLQSDF